MDGGEAVMSAEQRLLVGTEELVIGTESFGATRTSASCSGGLGVTCGLLLAPVPPPPEDEPSAAGVLKFGHAKPLSGCLLCLGVTCV